MPTSFLIITMLVTYKPFETKTLNNIEIMNETFLFFFVHLALVFTNHAYDTIAKYQFGFGLSLYIILVISINIIYIIYQMVKMAIKKHKKKKHHKKSKEYIDWFNKHKI